MSRPGNRRPQRPKVRNFVAKHAKDIARAAGAHKDKKHDYERQPRHRHAVTSGFDPFTGEPIEIEREINWVVGTVVPGQTFQDMPALPEGVVLRRVWTIIDHEKLEDEGLRHNVSAFLEDSIHDYQVKDGQIKFYSRVCEAGVPVELAFEYELPEMVLERPNARRKMSF